MSYSLRKYFQHICQTKNSLPGFVKDSHKSLRKKERRLSSTCARDWNTHWAKPQNGLHTGTDPALRNGPYTLPPLHQPLGQHKLQPKKGSLHTHQTGKIINPVSHQCRCRCVSTGKYTHCPGCVVSSDHVGKFFDGFSCYSRYIYPETQQFCSWLYVLGQWVHMSIPRLVQECVSIAAWFITPKTWKQPKWHPSTEMR